MKRIIQTLFVLSSLTVLFLSNQGGAATNGTGGMTGAPGDSGSCSDCHSGGSYAPTGAITVLDEAGTKTVTGYTAGTIYTIRFTITASGSPSGYGFQMIDIKKSDNTNVKGFSTAGAQGTNIQVSTFGNREYVEQNKRLASGIINVKWKAPATTTGTVVFYARGNAVNGNSFNTGDSPTASVSAELSPLASGVNELAQNVKIETYPNPVTEGVSITLNSEKQRIVKLQITDITGRVVSAQNWQLSTGINQKSVDLNNFIKGAYMLQVIENQNVISKKIIKI